MACITGDAGVGGASGAVSSESRVSTACDVFAGGSGLHSAAVSATTSRITDAAANSHAENGVRRGGTEGVNAGTRACGPAATSASVEEDDSIGSGGWDAASAINGSVMDSTS